LPTGDRLEELVGAYFLHVHPYQANAFLHRTTILQGLPSGALTSTLLLAICAVSARFTTPPSASAQSWAEQAAKDLVVSTSLAIEDAAAAVLLATEAYNSGLTQKASILCGIAVRQVIALGLHRGGPNAERTTWIEAEGRRRLYFACYCMERTLSDGSPDSTQCIAERVRIQLPCDGISYRLGIKTETPVPILEANESRIPFWLYKNLGTVGNYIRLVGIRHMIRK
jgi:hypothetical protein